MTRLKPKQLPAASTQSMPLPPFTSPVPQPVFMPGISHQNEAPPPPPTATASPLPVRPAQSTPVSVSNEEGNDKDVQAQEFDLSKLKLRLQAPDMKHTGARVFFGSVNASDCMDTCVQNVLTWLYGSPVDCRMHLPPARSVTLKLADMDGVAYTTGSDLDPDHKEIYFSMSYIANIGGGRQADEIRGVLTHELVHCLQYNGKGQAPGGLIEGIADWVRMKCGLSPPWWSPDYSGNWDAGYSTTAYFLNYLEGRFNSKSTPSVVRSMNQWLRLHGYNKDEKGLWLTLFGLSVDDLWEQYKQANNASGKASKRCDESAD